MHLNQFCVSCIRVSSLSWRRDLSGGDIPRRPQSPQWDQLGRQVHVADNIDSGNQWCRRRVHRHVYDLLPCSIIVPSEQRIVSTSYLFIKVYYYVLMLPNRTTNIINRLIRWSLRRSTCLIRFSCDVDFELIIEGTGLITRCVAPLRFEPIS